MYKSPWMTEELDMFADSLKKLFAKEFLPLRAKWEAQGVVDREAWFVAGEAGILCPSIPVEYGGVGGTLAYDAVIAQEFERAELGGGFGIGIGVQSMVAHYILAYGTEEQRQRWLPKMASGEIVAALGMTEPGTGSDLQGIATTAVAEGDAYRVNGQKVFISNGQTADLIMTVCNTVHGSDRGISLLMVEADSEGFVRGRNLDKIGLRAQDTSELFFEDVIVPARNLLGGETGQGFRQLMRQLTWERMVCALGAVVTMELAVDYTVAYVKQRKAFGKTLMDFQNTQFKLAECKTQACVARTFFDQSMVRFLAGELDSESAAMAKWWTTDTQGRVLDECLQLHGGYGYMLEYPIARLWRDGRILRIFAGTNEIMKLIIARSL